MLLVPKVQLPPGAKIVDGTVQTLPPRIVRDFLEQILEDPQEPPIDWYQDKFNFLDRFRKRLADRDNKTEGDKKTEGDFKTEGDKFLDGIPMTETIENGVRRRTDPFTLLWENKSLDFSLLENFDWGALKYHEMFSHVQVPFFGPIF